MAIFDLYSKRKIREERGNGDFYIYDDAPKALRVQIIHFYDDAYETSERGLSQYQNFYLDDEDFEAIVKVLSREYGMLDLVPHCRDNREQLREFIQTCSTERFLDCVEILCRLINHNPKLDQKIKDELHKEINFRFRDMALGYEYVHPMLIRIDSTVLHAEVVKPTIYLLAAEDFYRGAEQELFTAFDHFRKGEHKEAIANCLKSFESAMKSIHEKREWQYSSNDTASKLLSSCFSHGLVPAYMQTHFNSLRSLLESGVPTLRNKTSGHGQGSTPVKVPDYIVSYALHTATANIKLLIECEKSLPASE